MDDKEQESYHDSSRSNTPNLSSSFNNLTNSSATLMVPMSGASKLHPSPSMVESGDFSPALILDGSRAVAAFCRPYPVATVGIPERIDFDIASTKFKYTVRVRADDIANQKICTEIYLPFVHYAASLDSSRPAGNNSISGQANSTSTDGDDSAFASRQTSKVDLIEDERAIKSSDPASISIRSVPYSSSAQLSLDVAVVACHGRVEIKGQTLRWWYPVPEAGEEVYTIEVQRNGGALRRDWGYVQQGSFLDVCPECIIA